MDKQYKYAKISIDLDERVLTDAIQRYNTDHALRFISHCESFQVMPMTVHNVSEVAKMTKCIIGNYLNTDFPTSSHNFSGYLADALEHYIHCMNTDLEFDFDTYYYEGYGTYSGKAGLFDCVIKAEIDRAGEFKWDLSDLSE